MKFIIILLVCSVALAAAVDKVADKDKAAEKTDEKTKGVREARYLRLYSGGIYDRVLDVVAPSSSVLYTRSSVLLGDYYPSVRTSYISSVPRVVIN